MQGKNRFVGVKLSTEVWDQLAQQARAFGYTSGTVVFYCADRLTQLATLPVEQLEQVLPNIAPSWPPPRATATTRRWFLREDRPSFTRRGRRLSR